jgi:hypothetical protein
VKAFPTNIPVSSGGDSFYTDFGMDLRDYFAAKAMQSILSDNFGDTYAQLTKISYMVADAMMEARKA